MGVVNLFYYPTSDPPPSLPSEDLPSSCWQCYLVEWGDNKDTDRLSPWDMEPLPNDSRGSETAATGAQDKKDCNDDDVSSGDDNTGI